MTDIAVPGRDATVAVHLRHAFYGTVREDRSDGWIETGQHTLRLAQRVAVQQRHMSVTRVLRPPCVDVGEDPLLARPPVDRQAKCAFGDERVAAHGLPRGAGGVGAGRAAVAAGGEPGGGGDEELNEPE